MNPVRSWKWVAVTLILMVLAACTRQESKEKTNVSTELEMNHQIDLGTILDTTIPIQLSIPVTNRSARKITISKLSKDCSCTAVSIDKTSLNPGETAQVRVSTNLTGKTNLYMGEVIIESDATEKIDEIQIQGRITGQIRVRPFQTTLVLGEKYTPASFTVFSDDQNGKWRYTGFTSDDPNLQVEISLKSNSPTTSIYAGTVQIPNKEARTQYADYRQSAITLKFVNDQLGKTIELKHMVALVTRRSVTTDPVQVTFAHATGEQKRSVLVQSADAIDVDSVTCPSPCVKPSFQRIDPNTVMVQVTYFPRLLQGDFPSDISCDLHANGKMIASIPVHVVSVP